MIIDTYTAKEMKVLRLMTGLSAKTIAESVGVTKQTYYNIEKGATTLTGPMAISLTVAFNKLCEDADVDPQKVLLDYEMIKKVCKKLTDNMISKINKEIVKTD